jgi:Cu/Ag efflux protein CusF
MTKISTATLSVWMIMSSGLALAATDVSGVIGSVDWTIRQIVLVDGATYTIRRGIDLAKFKAGDKVTLRTEDVNGKNIVTKLTKGDPPAATLPPERKSRTY